MPQPFIVPEGVVFLIEEDGVTIENQGDVVLHTDFGGRLLKRIVSREGSIELHTPARAGILEAAQSVSVLGALHAGSVMAGGALRVAGPADLGALNTESAVVEGDLTAGTVACRGSVEVEGNVVSERVDAGGLRCRGARVAQLSVGADLTATGDAELGSLHVEGTATFAGNVSGTTLRANVITIGAGTVTARGIQARTRVSIGAAKLTVDAVLAPEVNLDPRTHGRVTVVESLNEVGPSGIKGGFRLADYAEMFGDASTFLAERGLTALGEAPAPRPEAQAPAAAEEDTADREPEAEAQAEAEAEAEAEASPAVAEVEEDAGDPESIEAGEADPEAEAEAAAQQEEQDGPAMVSIPQYAAPSVAADEHGGPEEAPAASEGEAAAAAEPEAEPEAVAYGGEPVIIEHVQEAPHSPVESAPAGDPLESAVEHPMHTQLSTTIQRIEDCYANAELPSAVERLRGLADARAYTEIRAEITNIWSELLKYHQKKGSRIHPMVTTTFNSVNSLVKKM